MGCTYPSQYQAPQDGRPRAVWSKNEIQVEPAGAPLSGACVGEALRYSGADTLWVTQPLQLAPLSAGEAAGYQIHGGYWVPRYYGPSIIVVNPGLAPPLLRPPVYYGGAVRGAFVPAPPAAGVRVSGGSSSGGGSGGGGDAGKALAVVALLALVVLPVIDLTVSLVPPEKIGRSSQAIDQVNALNDLLRSAGTPCSYGGAP